MMLFRMAWLWLTRRRRGRLPLLGTGVLRLRVWPGDLDLNLHMNNGRYFTVADLGRFDMWLRTGVWDRVFARGLHAVAGDSDGRYSRSLQPFEAFELRTQLLGWDHKWFFVEHRFVIGERVAAVVAVRYLFTGKQGTVAPEAVLKMIDYPLPSPPLPEWVEHWQQAQNQLSAVLKAERHATSA